MSEYHTTGSHSTYTGCNDCGGLRKLHEGKRPEGMSDCTCQPRWVLLAKRTNDPKLSYLERLLDARQIPHRRNGESHYAPILEVPEEYRAEAVAILIPIDNTPDSDPMFATP